MPFGNESQTSLQLHLALLMEIGWFATPITLSCCALIIINTTMLVALRSKAVFRETSRYIFFFNLLLADTWYLVISQILFLTHAFQLMLTYPVCGILVMLGQLVQQISPLTLVVMSLERYVAVCNPLRHAAIVTMKNTAVAVAAVWTFSLLNILIRLALLLQFPFEKLENLQMRTLCTTLVMFLVPAFHNYDRGYNAFLLASTGLTVLSSYIAVVIAAKSASTDKASARKASKTLLLHLVQLLLSLSSTIFSPLVFAISKITSLIDVMRVQSFLYLFVFLSPRCLISLIYGIRDQTFKPVLMYHFCCLKKVPAVQPKDQ